MKKYFKLYRELKKTVEYGDDGNTNDSWWTLNLNFLDSSDFYSIVAISQNTQKSPADGRRLIITQIPVKAYRLTLM